MNFWLMKSEPQVFSINDLAQRPGKVEPWDGIRNYQARNFMKDNMQIGDKAFFYHSSCPEPGIAGLMEISQTAFPDATQFDPTNKYFDAKATLTKPRWFNVEVKYIKKIRLITLSSLRANPRLATLQILKKGNRLSITPVTLQEWDEIMTMIK